MKDDRYSLIKIDDYVFQIHDNDTDMYMVAEEIIEIMNHQERENKSLKELIRLKDEKIGVLRKCLRRCLEIDIQKIKQQKEED